MAHAEFSACVLGRCTEASREGTRGRRGLPVAVSMGIVPLKSLAMAVAGFWRRIREALDLRRKLLLVLPVAALEPVARNADIGGRRAVCRRAI